LNELALFAGAGGGILGGKQLRYLSVCSGIEAATVAWHPLGWRAAAYSEIEKFPSAIRNFFYFVLNFD
jgi:site-specific DNA-cytosine methylase